MAAYRFGVRANHLSVFRAHDDDIRGAGHGGTGGDQRVGNLHPRPRSRLRLGGAAGRRPYAEDRRAGHGLCQSRAGCSRSAPTAGWWRRLRAPVSAWRRSRRRPWQGSNCAGSPTPTAPSPKGDADYALKRDGPRLARRRRLCAAGTQRLRQDHAAEHHLRLADPQRGAGAVRRRGCHAAAAAAAQHRPGVPVPGDLRHHDGGRQSGLPAAQPPGRRGGGPRPGRGGRGHAGTDRRAWPAGARADGGRQAEDLAGPRAGARATWRRSCSTSR